MLALWALRKRIDTGHTFACLLHAPEKVFVSGGLYRSSCVCFCYACAFCFDPINIIACMREIEGLHCPSCFLAAFRLPAKQSALQFHFSSFAFVLENLLGLFSRTSSLI